MVNQKHPPQPCRRATWHAGKKRDGSLARIVPVDRVQAHSHDGRNRCSHVAVLSGFPLAQPIPSVLHSRNSLDLSLAMRTARFHR